MQSSGTPLVVVLPVPGGSGTKMHTLTAAELGSPSAAATFKFKASRCWAAAGCRFPQTSIASGQLATAVGLRLAASPGAPPLREQQHTQQPTHQPHLLCRWSQ